MKNGILFFALALIAIFVACQKDIVSSIKSPSADAQNFMNVSKAKAWFDETEPKTVWTKTEKQKHYKPQWDKAVQLKNAVEVPVLLEDMNVIPTLNKDNPKQTGATRLLVACLDGKNIDGAIIKYFPSDKFVGEMADITRDNFRDKKFDGVIKLEDFGFIDQKVVLFEDGEFAEFLANSPRNLISNRDYTVCIQTITFSTVSVPSAGYYGLPTDMVSTVYCVTVPTETGGIFNGTINTTWGGGSGPGNTGIGLLNIGTGITITNRPCISSFLFKRIIPVPGMTYPDKMQGALKNTVFDFTPYTPPGETRQPVVPITIDWISYSLSVDAFQYANTYSQGTFPDNRPANERMRDVIMGAYQDCQQAIAINGLALNRISVQSYFELRMTANMRIHFPRFSGDCWTAISNPNFGNQIFTNDNVRAAQDVPALEPTTQNAPGGPPCR